MRFFLFLILFGTSSAALADPWIICTEKKKGRTFTYTLGSPPEQEKPGRFRIEGYDSKGGENKLVLRRSLKGKVVQDFPHWVFKVDAKQKLTIKENEDGRLTVTSTIKSKVLPPSLKYCSFIPHEGQEEEEEEEEAPASQQAEEEEPETDGGITVHN